MRKKPLNFAPEYSITTEGEIFRNGKKLNPSKTQFGGQKVDIH